MADGSDVTGYLTLGRVYLIDSTRRYQSEAGPTLVGSGHD